MANMQNRVREQMQNVYAARNGMPTDRAARASHRHADPSAYCSGSPRQGERPHHRKHVNVAASPRRSSGLWEPFLYLLLVAASISILYWVVLHVLSEP